MRAFPIKLAFFRTIRGKLMVASIICILVPAVLTMLIYNSLTEEAVKRQAVSNAADSMQLVNGSVSNLLQSMLNIENYIQVNADMNAYFKQYAQRGGATESDPYLNFTAVNRILQQLESLTAVGEKSYVSILLPDGTAFTNYSTDDFNPRAIMKEAWFKRLKDYSGFSTYWVGTTKTTFPYDKPDSPYQISVARTLRLENSSIYGYVIVTMMESKFSRILGGVKDGRELLMVDGEGKILSGSDRGRIGEVYRDGQTIPGTAKRPGSVILPQKGGKALVTEMKLPVNDWRLISVQPYKAAIVNISSIFNRVFTVQLVSFAAFLLLLLALLRTFTHPLVRLGRVANTVQRGNLEVRSGVRGQDEIGRLGFLFDQMLDRVKDMIAEVSHTQARKRKAELAMLQAQIHPHFLFNVLNSIRMKVMRTGDAESAKMIGSLSKLLRMTISREEDAITLHEEIELLVNYVDLMNLRQKEEVRLSLDIEADAFLVKVPRFCLQPLVENALIHGLSRSAGLIRVRTARHGRELKLTVEDDGAGMDEAQLDELRDKLTAAEGGPAKEGGELSGFGMANVAERMRIMFGDGFRMDVRSMPGEGTEVIMTIPVRDDPSSS
ncbi:cache domain-containing sensor histidine kinase [Cohnella sp. 56]|uniref:cache domain-containing sensor histidine kinase n=1 Tax=Cohnella sp. 56 TaxID=3113722 RepID=UPI0030E88BE1